MALNAKWFQLKVCIDIRHDSPPCQVHNPDNQAVTGKKHEKACGNSPPEHVFGNQADEITQQMRFGGQKKPGDAKNPTDDSQNPGRRSMESERFMQKIDRAED